MAARSNDSETRPPPPPPPPPPQPQRQPPRPLFLYGTLRALPLLAWALTGDSSKIGDVEHLVQPARVRGGYARFSLHGRDYPAVVRVDVEHPDAAAAGVAEEEEIDGLLLRPRDRSQRAKLDDFEGETYRAVPVLVEVETGRTVDGGGTETDTGTETETVDADIYVWSGAPDDVSVEEWDLEVFVRERLDDWLDLFGGIELVGDDDDDDDDDDDT